MTDAPRDLSRRDVLKLGGGFAAAAALGPWLDPTDALAASRWPQGRLTAKDAVTVRSSQFMPAGQLRRWHVGADKLGPKGQPGLRATGSDAERHHQDRLHDDLLRAGVRDVRFESVPMTRWTTTSWGLDVAGAPVRTASYVPYSGVTPAAGVTAPLAFVDDPLAVPAGALAGRIAVYVLPAKTLPLAGFALIGYGDRIYDPKGELKGDYTRPYLSQGVEQLDALQGSGAVGVVVILDYPPAIADGSYFPYDGVLRKVPGVYVDRDAGVALTAQARAGATATLKLPATVRRVKARNLLGMIPGRSSDRVVLLQAHTDGSNAVEDNGPDAVIAIAQYLARLPRRALPHSVLILLNTGHFHGGNGSIAFARRHKGDLVRRTNAALTLEHLGAKEWNELSPGTVGFTGRMEPGTFYVPGSKPLLDASFAALQRARVHPTGLLKPSNYDATGIGKDIAWGAEGQYLFAVGGIPDANFITGPSYLLNWGPTLDKVDFAVMRRQAIAFTEMLLRLGRDEREPLRTYSLR